MASFAYAARPWLLGAAAICLMFGFWRAYRPEPCVAGACAEPGRRRRARLVLWLSTALAVLAFTFQSWSGWVYYTLL